jgi:hypothetical protein
MAIHRRGSPSAHYSRDGANYLRHGGRNSIRHLPITLVILLQLVGSQAPLTSDLSAWYASKGLIVVGLILVLAAWSSRNALGS